MIYDKDSVQHIRELPEPSREHIDDLCDSHEELREKLDEAEKELERAEAETLEAERDKEAAEARADESPADVLRLCARLRAILPIAEPVDEPLALYALRRALADVGA